jgi:REP element-mobilizing transposase RayT
VFHNLAAQRESNIEAGHFTLDHVHMLISIPPEYAVSQVVRYIKGKSAISVTDPRVGFDALVTSFVATIATGWRDPCRVGLSPAEKPRLHMAHRIKWARSTHHAVDPAQFFRMRHKL